MFNEISFNKQNTTNEKWIKKNIGPFTMNLDIKDGGISSALYYQGGRELAFMNIMYNEIKEGDICVDLGSNIGYTTLFMCKKAGNSGKVYAIEPDDHNLEILKANIKENNFLDICEITKVAISDRSGDIDFWISDKPNLNSIQKTRHSTKKVTVPCETLGDFLKNRKYPNFIKMDIEGHEVSVFEGALDYFTKNTGKTSILLEVHPHMYNEKNDFEKILKEYFKIGFSSKYVVSTPIPDPKLFKESGYTPLAAVNTDGFVRGVYGNISNDHLLQFACRENIEGTSKKIVRSFMLSRD